VKNIRELHFQFWKVFTKKCRFYRMSIQLSMVIGIACTSDRYLGFQVTHDILFKCFKMVHFILSNCR